MENKDINKYVFTDHFFSLLEQMTGIPSRELEATKSNPKMYHSYMRQYIECYNLYTQYLLLLQESIDDTTLWKANDVTHMIDAAQQKYWEKMVVEIQYGLVAYFQSKYGNKINLEITELSAKKLAPFIQSNTHVILLLYAKLSRVSLALKTMLYEALSSMDKQNYVIAQLEVSQLTDREILQTYKVHMFPGVVWIKEGIEQETMMGLTSPEKIRLFTEKVFKN